MLPEKGTYYAQLENAVVGEGRTKTDGTKGAAQFVLSFQITHISKDNAWVDVTPFMRHVYVYLSEAAWETSQKKLESLGFNGLFNNPDFSAETKQGVQLTCSHETYEGKVRDKWELANWGGTEIKRASADIVRQLQAKWKAKAKPAAPAKTAAKPMAKPAPVTAPAEPGSNDGPEDLDIPEENMSI